MTMKMIRKRWLLVSLTLVMCASTRPVTAQERNVYWGDTHVHTSYSSDSYRFGTSPRIPRRRIVLPRGFPWSTRPSGAGYVSIGHSTSWRWRTTLQSDEGLPSKGTGTHPSSRRPHGRFMWTRPNETTTQVPSRRSLRGSGRPRQIEQTCIAWCSLRPMLRRRKGSSRLRPGTARCRRTCGTGSRIPVIASGSTSSPCPTTRTSPGD